MPKLLVFAVLVVSVVQAFAKTSVTRNRFGVSSNGVAVDVYTLKNDSIETRVLTFGGVIQSLRVRDRNGKMEDVVLGYDSLKGYESKENPYFGGLIGRYGNRIAKGAFSLDGRRYSIPANDGPNALHGGPVGFNKVIWKARIIPNGVELSYLSPDGDQGFPGALRTTVRYTLLKNGLQIEYSAVSSKDTVVNLTNHSYFDLSGQGAGNILGHYLQLNASHFTPIDSTLIPTGEIAPVAGTPYDFLSPHQIGERIATDDPQLRFAKGYDFNWVLDHKAGKLDKVAELFDPASGRVLEVLTTEPGIQFYSGNFLDGRITGKDGKNYGIHSGLCLETQHFPDSPNHPQFPSTLLRAGQKYESVTQYRFSVR